MGASPSLIYQDEGDATVFRNIVFAWTELCEPIETVTGRFRMDETPEDRRNMRNYLNTAPGWNDPAQAASTHKWPD